VIKVSQFVKQVPEVARALLPPPLQGFRVALMPWLSQSWYGDKYLHYELVKLPPRMGENRFELGLHFESKNRALNSALLLGFEGYLCEIRDELGENWHAELWDRGWTKVYTTIDYTVLDEAMLEQVAAQMAKTIRTLEPLFHYVYYSAQKRSA